MLKKFFSVFEHTFQLLTWLDNCIFGRSSGKYSRHIYSGEIGKLYKCTDCENTYYIVRRAAVFTCDVEFFASKEDGEAAIAAGDGAP